MKASEATVTGYRRPLGYQQIANAALAASVGLTIPTMPAGTAGPGFAVIQSNAGAVRWRDDGVAPTAAIGMLLPSGGELTYVGDMTALKFISSSGAPILDVALYD
jgi:hypothetical protein